MENIVVLNAKYHAENGVNISINCEINGVSYSIPLNAANRHYAEIMRQVDAGTLTIADAD
jgi:vancomycin permeability regulator SanA